MFDAGKTKMIGLPYGEKNYDNMLSRFYLIPIRYGQTDRQTDRRTDRRSDLLYQYGASVFWRAIKIIPLLERKVNFQQYPYNTSTIPLVCCCTTLRKLEVRISGKLPKKKQSKNRENWNDSCHMADFFPQFHIFAWQLQFILYILLLVI